MATAIVEQDEDTGGNSGSMFEARPDLYEGIFAMRASMMAHRQLPHRLIELVRLRIAYRNQCRPCMSMRYGDAVDDGVTEALVCELEKPLESKGLSEAEKLAVLFADTFASNHLAVDARMKADLARHFSQGEIAELALWAASFVGFGRVGAIFDGGEALPVGALEAQGDLAPWRVAEPIVQR